MQANAVTANALLFAPSRAVQLGLSDATVKVVTEIFAHQPKIRKAIVYGSRAMGTYREGSDIDIALDAPDLTFSELQQLCGALEDTNIPYTVDLSVLSKITNPKLVEHIYRVGKALT